MNTNKPTAAYIGASWSVLLVGILAYLFSLWNAETMMLNEKGYYFTVLAFGLYGAISLQKTVRDHAEGIPTSNMYYWISWSALILAVSLIIIGLYNAGSLNLSEKGFYLMAYTMSVFAAITVQKNTRDMANYLASMTALPQLEQPQLEQPQLEQPQIEQHEQAHEQLSSQADEPSAYREQPTKTMRA